MSSVRVAFTVVILGLVSACEEPVGEVVTCAHTFTCGQTVVANNDLALAEGRGVFCTDPSDPDRDALIGEYEAEFAATCDGVIVTCNGDADDRAVCAAACAVTGTCDLATAVDVRL